MNDLHFLKENIFHGSDPNRSLEVDKVLDGYQSLTTDQKKEFINLFFDEKVFDTSVVDKHGTLVIIFTSKELD